MKYPFGPARSLEVTAYYNEIVPYAAQWLRNLINAGHVAPGEVDERSITDVRPLSPYLATQAHFFAGIGVWSHALRLAGWPDDAPVWTGSCPCQPFSIAGTRKGTDDVRHLWPIWFDLIRECKPPIIFGEQVARGTGLDWFAAVRVDLESAGYAVGAADLCAAGAGAPHLRQRLYFVAYARGTGLERWRQAWATKCGSDASTVGDTDGCGIPRDTRRSDRAQGTGEGRRFGTGGNAAHAPSADGFWTAADWLSCTDGKARPVEPGTFPLAYGPTTRVERLRAYGNAIVAPQAAAFIRAAAHVIAELPAAEE